MTETEQFLRALWPEGAPEGGCVVVATKGKSQKGGFAPLFFTDMQQAAVAAVKAGKKLDTYVGMAAMSVAVKAPSRGTASDVVAIPGLWLDLDFDKGFVNEVTARKFLASLPVPPSLVVASGGGVHAHWLFKEPLDARTDEEREYAHGLLIGWLEYCRELAKLQLKATMDAVADLARVMRLPGTFNFKRDEPSTARLLVGGEDAQRYNPSDFDTWRASGRRVNHHLGTKENMDFALRAHAQPPADKWVTALDNDSDLKAVWEHRMKMPTDNSCSGYDLSLAQRLDLIGFTPQEIVDTLVAHRTKWEHKIVDEARTDDPLHLNDPGYYERVLRKARATNQQERISAQAAAMAEEVTEEVSTLSPGDPPPPTVRARFFHSVSQIMGFTVVDLYANDRVESPIMLRVVCAGGEQRDFKFTRPSYLINDWTTWCDISIQSGVARDTPLPRKMPTALRDLMSRASGVMLRIQARVTESDEVASHLWEMAQECLPFEEANLARRQPYRRLDHSPQALELYGEPTECFFVSLNSIRKDIKGDKLSKFKQPLPHLMLQIGFTRRAVAARTVKDQSTTRSYWCIPMKTLRAAASKGLQRIDRAPMVEGAAAVEEADEVQ